MLEAGLSASIRLSVGDADTAPALGSGDVPVLGTPRLIALCEAATLAAVTGGLADGETSVGTRVEIDHLAPSPIGTEVTATATLDEADGDRLRFSVIVRDGDHTVAVGSIHRVIVDRQRFLRRLERDTS
ncbi:MAG: thioesterase [Acidimicrobiia bacterium]|nr:thioesterase [Acidimicrobiia bacterium]